MSHIRVPLGVNVYYMEDGEMRIKSIVFDDRTFEVQKIIKKRRIAPPVSCIAPIEYTIKIDGKVKKIYFEAETNKWFFR